MDTDESDAAFYERFNTQQRICVARDIGSALAEMGKLSFTVPGTLDPDTFVQTNVPGLGVLQFQCPNRNAFRPASNEKKVQAKPQRVFDFLMDQCDRQRKYDIICGRELTNPWPMLKAILSEMNSWMDLFDDDLYYLMHMDFEPRNLLVDIVDE